jgi:hypothetical protein
MMRRTVLLSLIGIVAIVGGMAAYGGGRSDRAQADNPDAEIHVIAISNSICLAFGGALPVPCFDLWNPASQQKLADIITNGAPEAQPRGDDSPAAPTPGAGTPVTEDTRICPVKIQPDTAPDPKKLESADPGGTRCRLLPSDFEALRNLTGNQLHSDDPANSSAGVGPFEGLYIMAFVPTDQPVEFSTTAGKFVQVIPDPAPPFAYPAGTTAGPFPNTDNHYVCQAPTDDCNGDGKYLKGLVVVPLGGYGAALGPARVTVSQGNKQAALDLTVVGEPDSIKIDTFKGTISNGITDIEGTIAGTGPDDKLNGPNECPLPVDLAGFTNALARPDKTVLIGRILDSAGTQITQGWVYWSGTGTSAQVPIGPVAQFGAPITPTVNLGSFGFGAPQVLCGTKGTGTITASAMIFKYATGTPIQPGLLVDVGAHNADTATLDFNVIGQVASVSAVADPPTVDCDGTNTSTVTATVLTADGQPIANGQQVNFSVQALGIAKPITSSTGSDKGQATTVVTPLSPVDELRGVTVNISTIPSNSTAEPATTSVLINCTGSAVPVAGAPGSAGGAGAGAGAGTSAPTGEIHGPDTGSGPSKGAGGLAWWPLLMLAAGAVVLGGVRFATKRD